MNIKQIFADVAKVLLDIIEENDLTKDEIVATLKAWKCEKVVIKTSYKHPDPKEIENMLKEYKD